MSALTDQPIAREPEPWQSPSLWQCFRIQVRVVGALILRESLTRYGRHNIGFMWMFLEPMMFTLGVTAVFSLAGAHKAHSGISMAAFIYTGYSTILLWRNMPQRAIGALKPNFALMFHQQVTPIDVYISRLVLEFMGATISMVVLGIAFTAFGLVHPPKNPLQALFGWGLLAWFAFSLSLFVGAISEKSEIVDRVYHIFNYLMIPLSGSFFMVDSLPKALQSIVLLNPTVNCVELFRSGFFGDAHVWHYDIGYVVLANMILTVLGLAKVRQLNRTLAMEY
jgi:ABC-type polysaccharide/polyol phosphate export permease